jgi:hypothetical protein
MHLPELTTHLTGMFTEDNLRIYVDANRDLDNRRRLRFGLNGLGIFVELLLQLQQFKAASLARFPTTPQKRALPRVGHPLRAGLFSKWLTERYQSVCRRFLKSAGKDRSLMSSR